jgi:hypothetical protein
VGSHAEGYAAITSGSYSHAEGFSTIARGQGSHAEGQGTIASGSYSHAGGIGTISLVQGSTALGLYNLPNTRSIFQVGGGAGEDSRKNIFEVTQAENTIIVPQTRSSAPSHTGTDGEIVPATISGQHYLYMWMGGAWRSSSFS